jgi:hypothetical protein
MSNQSMKSSNAKLILAMAVVLSMIYLAQPYISDMTSSEKTSAPTPNLAPHASPPSAEQSQSTSVQDLPAGTDPFKAHIEKNGLSGNTNLSTKSATSANTSAPSTNTASPGTDPFKGFLDQQKKQSKDAGVSPFGK